MNWPDDYINKIIQGDCSEVMKGMPDKSVDLVVTSPPYDNLRTYEGYKFNFETVAEELYRIIRPGGVLVWVVGDSVVNGSETGNSFRQALYFKGCSFNLHDTMIYQSEKPPLTHNRYEQKFEYMFIFSKGSPKSFFPLLEKTIYFGANLNRPKVIKGSRSQNSAIRSRNEDMGKVKEFKYKGNIWSYKTGGGQTSKDSFSFEHPATFPELLANDHIVSWSKEGDLVLDPMNGSGTTTKMAKILNRKFMGIEISKKYCKIAEDRLRQESLF